jgi:Papain family cysteine protease
MNVLSYLFAGGADPMKRALILQVVIMGMGLPSVGWDARAADERPLPRTVDLRPDFKRFGLVPKAQGARDVCSLFAITGLAEFELAKQNPERPRHLSEEFLIWAANEAKADRHEQAMFYEATHGLETMGICSQELMPYQNSWNPKRKPSLEATADAKRNSHWIEHWIKRWNVNGGLSDSQLHAVKLQLADSHPVAAGMRWPKQVHLTSDHVLNTPPPAGVSDGHSILIVGYMDDEKHAGGGMFIFRNSFGPGWGKEGYAYMTYAYARAYINDAVSLNVSETGGGRQHVVILEAESLRVAGANRCRVSTQGMAPWGAKLWSGGKQLYCQSENGGVVDLDLTIREGGLFHFTILATCAPDYGKIRVELDGEARGTVLDLYGGRVFPSGPVEIGDISLKAGRHRLRLASAGKNEFSEGFSFGIDAIEFRAFK